MGVDLRIPNISPNASEREQLVQIRSYLFQLVEQLQWAMNNIETSQTNTVVTTSKGSTATAPQAAIDSQATFDAIKYLIIKSADIVEAYYEEINKKLVSEYVAVSDFGEFREQGVQEIIANSTEIEQFFTNIQELTSEIEDINFKMFEVNAHIKSGLLYEEDGIPVYGLEIGQKNTVDGVETFNKYARFTADRLSFYDQNDAEVAYISNYKIHITHAEVTGTLKLGGYLVDTTNGLAFRWEGRG